MEKISYIGKCLLIQKSEKRVLIIGDVHLGEVGKMGIGGIDLAGRMFNEMISELDKVFEKIGEINRVNDKRLNASKDKIINDNSQALLSRNDRVAVKENKDDVGVNVKEKDKIINKIILLGDLKHEFSGLTKDERNELVNFLGYLEKKCREIIVIRGNHDNYLLNIIAGKGIKLWDFYKWKEFCFSHGDRNFKEIWDKKIKYLVIGHLHPAIVLRDGIKAEKYKCFLEGKFKGKKIIIVPSFIEIGEGANILEIMNDSSLIWKFALKKFKVMVINENLEVIDFGKLARLK